MAATSCLPIQRLVLKSGNPGLRDTAHPVLPEPQPDSSVAPAAVLLPTDTKKKSLYHRLYAAPRYKSGVATEVPPWM